VAREDLRRRGRNQDAGQSKSYSYYVTGTSRGERADPLGNLYSVYYDDRARALQFIDEENRAVNQTFDNHDRVAQRTYPEGNSVQFAYDDVTQQVKRSFSSVQGLSRLPKRSYRESYC